MIKGQFKKKFGTEGTKKSRKQAQVAISRGRTPNKLKMSPFYNPDKKRFTTSEKILNSINAKLNRTM